MAETHAARLRPNWAWERIPRLIVVLVQLGLFGGAGILAFLLRFDLEIPPQMLNPLSVALASWVVA